MNTVPPAQPMTILRANPPVAAGSRCVGTIAVCTRDQIKAETALSWLMIDFSFLKPGEYVSRYFVQGNVLTAQRDACIAEMEGDWILFLDDDMTFQPEAVGELVMTQRGTGADIVGGLCFQRRPPHQPTLYRYKEGVGYAYMEDWRGIVDVDATGLAFCLITVDALNKILRSETQDPDISFPSREERKRIGAAYPFFQWTGRWGEDFLFCQIAKKAGCRIVVDTDIEIGHISETNVTKKSFWREIAFRSNAEEEGRRVVNEAVGLPILDREEALRRLR